MKRGEMGRGNERRAKKLESNRRGRKLGGREMEERLGREAREGEKR